MKPRTLVIGAVAVGFAIYGFATNGGSSSTTKTAVATAPAAASAASTARLTPRTFCSKDLPTAAGAVGDYEQSQTDFNLSFEKHELNVLLTDAGKLGGPWAAISEGIGPIIDTGNAANTVIAPFLGLCKTDGLPTS